MAPRLPYSAGTGGLANNPLAQLYLGDKIMDMCFERDFLFEITNSDIPRRITSCPQNVQLIDAPPTGSSRIHSPGQPMGHVTAKELSICYAADIHVKFDETTLPFCRNWSRCKDMLFEACSRLFVESQRNFVLSDFIALADPKNKGNRAGKNGQYTLGQMGAPYRITPKTIPHFFSQVRNVLAEHVPWVGGQMFMLVPLEFRTIFMLSDYAKQAWPGISAASTNILGIWPQIVNGFNIFDTTHLPHFKDASDTTRPCHYIIAGHKEAYAYAADIIGERVVMDIDPFSINYKMLSVWGGAMLHPNFAALAYVNFDAEMTVT